MPTGSVILFDLDGVLVDSRRPITRCINHALASNGLPEHPPETLARFIGPPLIGAFAELTGRPADSPLVLSCVAAYRALYAEVSLRETEVVPGIHDVLGDLAERYRLAVATSKPLAFAEPLIDALGLRPFFELCAGPELDASGEAKAVTIAAALERLGSRWALMVGDRGLDIVAAHACGLPGIGVTWGIGRREELEAAQPDALVEAPRELPEAIRSLDRDPTVHSTVND
jgi:phosphoglycolate phosphatase